MGTVEKIAGSMFMLIFVYLVITNAPAVNNVVTALSNAVNNQITALQGR